MNEEHHPKPKSNQKQIRKKPITGVSEEVNEVIKKIISESPPGESLQLSVILQKLKEEVPFEGSRTSLRTIIYKLGYKYVRTQNRSLLVEKSHAKELVRKLKAQPNKRRRKVQKTDS